LRGLIGIVECRPRVTLLCILSREITILGSGCENLHNAFTEIAVCSRSIASSFSQRTSFTFGKNRANRQAGKFAPCEGKNLIMPPLFSAAHFSLSASHSPALTSRLRNSLLGWCQRGEVLVPNLLVLGDVLGKGVFASLSPSIRYLLKRDSRSLCQLLKHTKTSSKLPNVPPLSKQDLHSNVTMHLDRSHSALR
jgi:hypothetical protein